MHVARLYNRSGFLYQRYDRMVCSLAHHFAGKFNRPYLELLDIARWGLADALVQRYSAYDATKCKVQTWLWRKTYWRLMDHCLEEAQRGANRVGLDQAGDVVAQGADWVSQLLQELDDDARVVVGMVLSGEIKLPKRKGTVKGGGKLMVHMPWVSKQTLQEHLAERGWDAQRIQKSFQKVEQALSGAA